jgi:hypothetical protein
MSKDERATPKLNTRPSNVVQDPGRADAPPVRFLAPGAVAGSSDPCWKKYSEGRLRNFSCGR